MALTKLINYKEASPKVKKIFDDIMKTRKTKYVNNIWRALALSPKLLDSFWTMVKEIMIKPSKIDPLNKELIYLAVSITNNCEYCIKSHYSAAKKKGLTDEVFAEFNQIVALANATNKLTHGLQVDVDDMFINENMNSKWTTKK
tara:strand:- start:357 stop:788 length:432 start_codon:yes stop_codon:yes gene_type:complete